MAQEEYESFESEGNNQQQIREELKNKPDILRRYKNKLHQATFNNNKAGCFRNRGNKDKSIKFRNLSESHCEYTLEIMQEIVDADASLHMWFDRGLDFRKRDVELGHIVSGRSATIATHLQHWLSFIGKETKLKELERTDCENYFYHRQKSTNSNVKQVTVQNEQIS